MMLHESARLSEALLGVTQRLDVVADLEVREGVVEPTKG
jgi:hypothetical protein